MQNNILRHAPDNWDTGYSGISNIILLNQHCHEYRQIVSEVKIAAQNNNLRVKSIKRYQNIHDYGQYVLRAQLLAIANSNRTFYKVRKYITIKKNYLNRALDYNLDPRRCGKASLCFQKYINSGLDEVILVVQVVSSEPNSNVSPNSSSEYFIEYIVETD